MKKKFWQTILALLVICVSQIALADMTEACKSCVGSYDCSRINKTCNATCQANLFQKQDDLDSCRAGCIGKLEKCLLNAKKSCSFNCDE